MYKPKKSQGTEHENQTALIEWANMMSNSIPELRLLYAIPNEIRTSNKWATIRMKKEGLKKGVPDLNLAAPMNGKHGLFIEMKAGRNKPTEEQDRWLKRLNVQEYLAVVCWGVDDAIETIERYLKPVRSKRDTQCVYQILNKINGKRYIGSAVQFYSRRSGHFGMLRRNEHHSDYLQDAWNEYGESAFVMKVIEWVHSSEILTEREQYWMDFYESYNQSNGYNVAKFANSSSGTRHTYATKKKLSDMKKGKPFEWSDEHRKNHLAATSGQQSDYQIAQKTGEKNPNAKLSAKDVRKIKKTLSFRGDEHGILSEIARWYGVTPSCIYGIKIGKRWKDVS